jgi:hypothetical protein
MAIVRRLISQDHSECQPLRVDHGSRYIVNNEDCWQMIFNLNSELSNTVNILKVAAELDTNSLNKIRLVAYLWDNIKDSINQASSCVFKVYKVNQPSWSDDLVYTINGVEQLNSYLLAEVDFNAIPSANLDGDSTLMIEVTMVRLGQSIKERVYINHLGIYDSFLRLKQEVEFLDLTKLDE